MGSEEFDDVGVAIHSRPYEGCVAVAALCVDICSALDEKRCDVGVASPRRLDEGGVASVVFRV